jgi:hypothetical protein
VSDVVLVGGNLLKENRVSEIPVHVNPETSYSERGRGTGEDCE